MVGKQFLHWQLLAFALVLSACDSGSYTSQQFNGEVKVGILHSRTGSLSISEHTVAEAELMAIAEIDVLSVCAVVAVEVVSWVAPLKEMFEAQ